MQIVQSNFTELGTELFKRTGDLFSNEYCILDKSTNKFYARSHKYTDFGKCEIVDRFLEWLEFDSKTKTIIVR